ncbi:MAG: hypothetical protein AB7P21_30010 [Lautropia sp.]
MKLPSLLLLVAASLCCTPDPAAATDVCALERGRREAAGLSGDGPACQAMSNPSSALARAMGYSEEQLFGCKVALCMAAPDGPDSVAQCQPVMAEYKTRLGEDPESIPACPLMWADNQGSGGVTGTVDYRGRVQRDENGNGQTTTAGGDGGARYEADAEGVGAVAGYLEQAYATYGPASLCLSGEQLLANQGQGDAYIAGVRPEWEWSNRGWATSVDMNYANLPGWAQGMASWMRGMQMTHLLPWFVAGGVAGSNGTVSFEVGRMTVQYLSATDGQWHVIAADMPGSGHVFEAWSPASSQTLAAFSGGATFQAPNFAHGWFNFIPIPPDAVSYSVTAQARSTGGEPVMFEVGMDPYNHDRRAEMAGQVIPGMGTGAPRLLGENWTTVSFTMLTTQTHNGSGVSPAQLLANPPTCGSAQ